MVVNSGPGARCNALLGGALILVGLGVNVYVLEHVVFAGHVAINSTLLRAALWVASSAGILAGVALICLRHRIDSRTMGLFLATVGCGLLLFEVGARWIKNDGPANEVIFITDDVLITGDEQQGYRYKPGLNTVVTLFGPHEDQVLHEFPFHTNAQGWRSRYDYDAPKAATEFRIGVIGDSFTAGSGTSVPWTALLEDELNRGLGADHGTVFRVLNFGLGGAGFWHFDRVRQHEIPKYDVDLLVIAYIHGDVRRKPVWRWSETRDGAPVAVSCRQPRPSADRAGCQLCPAMTPANLRAKSIGRLRADPSFRCRGNGVAWPRSLLPIGIASLLDGAGIRASYYLESVFGNATNYSLHEGVARTTAIINTIRDEVDDVIFLHLPLGRSIEESLADWHNTQRLIPELGCPRCTSLAEYLTPADGAALPSAYVPHDGHHNDQGAAITARAAYLALQNWIKQGLADRRAG